MRLLHVPLTAVLVLGLLTLPWEPALAQEPARPETGTNSPAQPPSPAQSPTGQPSAAPAVALPEPDAAAAPAAPEKKTYTVPSGTRVLLQLRSGVNTRSATPGDGVYLASTFPVVVGNRVMIPTGVYVQGMVDRVQRGGMRAKAQLDMHFTSIIFPNGTVAEIPGVVDNMPGSTRK